MHKVFTWQRLFTCLSVMLFLFILWIIYLANSGNDSIFFDLVRALPFGDKLGHLGLFGMLTFLFIVAFRFKTFSLRLLGDKQHDAQHTSYKSHKGLKIYYGVALVSVFMLLEEASQAFIPSRTLDILDISANVLGIALATITARFLQPLFLRIPNFTL